MSKIFYDHLIDFGKLDKLIKTHVKNKEARDEIYRLVDEILHHRVLGCILDRLPKDSHREFLDSVKAKAHDESILEYIRSRVTEDVEEFIRQEIVALSRELIELFDHKSQHVHKS